MKTLSFIKNDKDGMGPHQRALEVIYKFLFNSRYIYTPDIEIGICCDEWHRDQAIVVYSQKRARLLAKLISSLESCICKSLIAMKRICVGPKRPVIKQATGVVAHYLEEFWRKQGVMNIENAGIFDLDLCKLSFILLHGVEYRVNDMVIVEPDLGATVHSWTWKGKISAFFLHEFYEKMQIFFEAAYFGQQMEDSDLTMPLVHHTTWMQILNARPNEIVFRLVQQLMYKFMILPTSHSKYVVTFELENEAPRTHLLEAGQPGCVPPFPELGDIMLVKKDDWRNEDLFAYAIVNEVSTRDGIMEMNNNNSTVVGISIERDNLVGTVELCMLNQLGPRSRKYVAMADDTYSCSWHKLIKQVVKFNVTKRLRGQPVEWTIFDIL